MGVIAEFVSALLYAQPATNDAPRACLAEEHRVCGLADRQISMPEMIMASAFLDFGGLPGEHFLHEWRISGHSRTRE
jgi:hypothetical protein